MIYHQYCDLLIADKTRVGLRKQSSYLVDRSGIDCIGIERRVQNCSYAILQSHTLQNSTYSLAFVNCRGQLHCNDFMHASPLLIV